MIKVLLASQSQTEFLQYLFAMMVEEAWLHLLGRMSYPNMFLPRLVLVDWRRRLLEVVSHDVSSESDFETTLACFGDCGVGSLVMLVVTVPSYCVPRILPFLEELVRLHTLYCVWEPTPRIVVVEVLDGQDL